MLRPPPSLLGARRRRRVAGGSATNGRKRGVGGIWVGETVGAFYRATGGHGPSDGGSAGADASRDAYAGRAQGFTFRCFSGFLFAQEKREKSFAMFR